jgi:hypothetical protein
MATTLISFAGGQLGCAEYCRVSAEQIEKAPVRDVFPLDSLSDHKLVSALVNVNGQLIRVAAWNVLNKKYAQMHMVKSTHGQPLHEHEMASRDPQKQRAREQAILDRLDLGINGFDIICLQEVSADLLGMIQVKFAGDKVFVDRDKYNADGSLKDCNVLLARQSLIKVCDKTPFFYEDEKTIIHLYHAKIKGISGTRFGIVTAHMPWDIKNKFPEVLLAADGRDRPTLVCGDFNCGVRMPVLNNGVDHLIKYAHPRFVFPSPAAQIKLHQPHAQRGATHVCCMRNIGNDESRLLDVFDHIVLLMPPAPVEVRYE